MKILLITFLRLNVPAYGQECFETGKLETIPSRGISALNPAQTAFIVDDENSKGQTDKVFVYELDVTVFKGGNLSSFQEISKFPEIRRDLAILVNQAIPARDIQDTIKVIAGDWLKDVFIFDVYQGKGISPGLKSIALALVFQHPTRTLVDDEVTALIERIVSTLKGKLGAELRR